MRGLVQRIEEINDDNVRRYRHHGAAVANAVAVISQPASAAPDDSALVELEEQIFQANEAETENDEEIIRLFNIWDPELRRLQEELKAGRSPMTEEIWARVKQMPEVQEHTRLCLLKHSIFCKKYRLIEQMQAIPARTPEGRRAKLLVLLNFNVTTSEGAR